MRPSAHRRLWAFAAACFVAGSVALAWPWLSGTVTIPWDARAQAYPQLAFLAQSFASGQSPFWAPEVFAGHPQIADPQSLIFSPPYLLLALLDAKPSFQAADAVTFVMLVLAGLCILAFFRDRGWRAEGALIAAFAFAFGGSNAWRLQHVGEVLSLCWFAIGLWLLSRALSRGSSPYGLAAGVVAGFMVLGRDQIALLCAYLLVLYVLIYLFGGFFMATFRAIWRPLVAGVVGGIVTVAVPLAFTLSLAAQSNRPTIDFASAARGSLSPFALLTAVVANLYGVDGPMQDFWGPPSTLVWADNDFVLARNMGAIYFGAVPLAALFFFAASRLTGESTHKKPETLYFLAGVILTGLYALGSSTPFFGWAFHLPGVDLYRRPADATFPFCAMLAFLAGAGVDALLRAEALGEWRPAQRALGVAGLAAALAACGLVAMDKARFAQAQVPLAIAAVSILVAVVGLWFLPALSRRSPWLAVFAVATVMTLDLAVSNKPNESTGLPPSQYQALQFDSPDETLQLIKARLAAFAAPDRRDRVELAAVGYEWPNAGLVHGFDHDLGFNPVRLKLFTDATNAQDQIAIPDQRTFSPLYAGFRSPLADLLGVRLLLAGVPPEQMDKNFDPADFNFVARTKQAYIYENPRALPRVLFASEVRQADFAAMLKDGGWPALDFRRTVLLETADTVARAPGAANIVKYRNTEVVVEASAPQGGYVVLNDIFHPWWRVEVDGAPATLLRANVMFRAVLTPPGKHLVRFYFAPFAGLWGDLAGRP